MGDCFADHAETVAKIIRCARRVVNARIHHMPYHSRLSTAPARVSVENHNTARLPTLRGLRTAGTDPAKNHTNPSASSDLNLIPGQACSKIGGCVLLRSA